MKEVKIVAISDTHNKHRQLIIPECDILIHAGDFSSKGYEREVKDFYGWFDEQPANYKISVWGNHEIGCESNPENMKNIMYKECPNVIHLHDNSVEIAGINVYGSAWTPYFYNWAFNGARNEDAASLYKKPLMKDIVAKIPEDTDVLITHGPPSNILDELCYYDGPPNGQFVGCEDLLKRVKVIKPDLHLFGHIHCAYGQLHKYGTSFYNVANCDERYMATNPVTIIDYIKK
jgi:Icc-related predicted phosphoesterase